MCLYDTYDRQNVGKEPAALQLLRRIGYREIGDYNANPYASYWFEKAL